MQEALGDLVTAAREGLLALSVDVGLGVLAELMDEEVVEVVGAKGKHDPDRVAVRHGHESGEVTLGGRCVGVARPRVRSADGASELPLATYRHFADRDPLTRVVLERMLAGVSNRRYRRIQEPVGREFERQAPCPPSRRPSFAELPRRQVRKTRPGLRPIANELVATAGGDELAVLLDRERRVAAPERRRYLAAPAEARVERPVRVVAD